MVEQAFNQGGVEWPQPAEELYVDDSDTSSQLASLQEEGLGQFNNNHIDRKFNMYYKRGGLRKKRGGGTKRSRFSMVGGSKLR